MRDFTARIDAIVGPADLALLYDIEGLMMNDIESEKLETLPNDKFATLAWESLHALEGTEQS